MASPKRVSGYGKFRTPTGNIVCQFAFGDGPSKDSVECGIKSGLVGVHPVASCKFGDPQTDRVELDGLRKAFRVTCAGDPGPFLPPLGPVLPYGKTLHRGDFLCASAFTGLTCRSHAGHGFFLSRQRWRVF